MFWKDFFNCRLENGKRVRSKLGKLVLCNLLVFKKWFELYCSSGYERNCISLRDIWDVKLDGLSYWLSVRDMGEKSNKRWIGKSI